jgi:CRISPR/Cas system-associated endonuclease Cas1
MSFLYLTEHSTRLHMEGGRVIAEDKVGLKTILPTELLEGIVVMNANGVTIALQYQNQ